jgi:hypothetical protein
VIRTSWFLWFLDDALPATHFMILQWMIKVKWERRGTGSDLRNRRTEKLANSCHNTWSPGREFDRDNPTCICKHSVVTRSTKILVIPYKRRTCVDIARSTQISIGLTSNSTTSQQAIAKTPAKSPAYQISSVIVVFVILVFKVLLRRQVAVARSVQFASGLRPRSLV